MSDDDIVISSPTVAPPPPAPSHSEAITAAFQDNLKAVARGTEDASDYIKEREVQTKHENGQAITAVEQNEWAGRHEAALQRARNAAALARGETPPQSAPVETDHTVYVGQGDPEFDTFVRAAQPHFDAHFDDPSNIGGHLTARDHKAAVLDWAQTVDPQGRLTGYWITNQLGPAMLDELYSNYCNSSLDPQDIYTGLANATKRELDNLMLQLRGRVATKAEIREQQRGIQRAQETVHRQTMAPPPMKTPRGAANVPSDLYSLANRDDAGSYVKARQAQMRRAEQD
jgi:hypothetical protein